MSKKNRKVNMMENQNIEVNNVDEELDVNEEAKAWKHEPDKAKIKEFGVKVKSGVKKHGKKVITVAAIIGGVLLYELGRKKGEGEPETGDCTGTTGTTSDCNDQELPNAESETVPFGTEETNLEETGT